MTKTHDKSTAIVVLPAVRGGRLQDAKLRAWLSRSTLRITPQPREILECVVSAINLPYPVDGLAALRLWGQTSDQPTVWIAAADPIYLEPRLDYICLHALGGHDVPASHLRTLFDHLQQSLTDGSRFGFVQLGSYGYLRSKEPMATALSSANVVDQQSPNDFMPSGTEAADYRRLIGEVEMSLHDHDVNLKREAEGRHPINSLWLWGGGFAPQRQAEPCPPLFADDPMTKGYWHSITGVVDSWPGSIAACLDASDAGFVAVPAFDADDVEALQECLRELREALHARRLSRLVLFFRDGVEAVVLRTHAWRFWRRAAPVLS